MNIDPKLINQWCDESLDHSDTVAYIAQRAAEYGAQQERERLLAGSGEPVTTVEVEPDYMSRGHFYKGSRPYIKREAALGLPIGTTLYTADQLAAARLQGELVNQQLLSDAKRYRWLREQPIDSIDEATYLIIYNLECQLLPGGEVFETLDAAIDAAIAAAEEPQ